jgi:hypothetical protein
MAGEPAVPFAQPSASRPREIFIAKAVPTVELQFTVAVTSEESGLSVPCEFTAATEK